MACSLVLTSRKMGGLCAGLSRRRIITEVILKQVWVKKTTWLTSGLLLLLLNWKQGHNHLQASYDYSFDASINLPQLFSPESAAVASSFISPLSLNSMDIESSRNLLRQASTGGSCGLMQQDQIR